MCHQIYKLYIHFSLNFRIKIEVNITLECFRKRFVYSQIRNYVAPSKIIKVYYPRALWLLSWLLSQIEPVPSKNAPARLTQHNQAHRRICQGILAISAKHLRRHSNIWNESNKTVPGCSWIPTSWGVGRHELPTNCQSAVKRKFTTRDNQAQNKLSVQPRRARSRNFTPNKQEYQSERIRNIYSVSIIMYKYSMLHNIGRICETKMHQKIHVLIIDCSHLRVIFRKLLFVQSLPKLFLEQTFCPNFSPMKL